MQGRHTVPHGVSIPEEPTRHRAAGEARPLGAPADDAYGELIGVAVGRVDRDRGWVLRLTLHPQWRGQGLGSELLTHLEQRLMGSGARRLTCVLPEGETGTRR